MMYLPLAAILFCIAAKPTKAQREKNVLRRPGKGESRNDFNTPPLQVAAEKMEANEEAVFWERLLQDDFSSLSITRPLSLVEQTGNVPIGPIGGNTDESKTASLFQGDLMLTREEAEQYGEEFVQRLEEEDFQFLELPPPPFDLPPLPPVPPGRNLAVTFSGQWPYDHRWPNRNEEGRLEIEYMYQPGLDMTRRTVSRDAMNRLEDSGVVRFIERTPTGGYEDLFDDLVGDFIDNESPVIAKYFVIGIYNVSKCSASRTGYHRGYPPQSSINLGSCNSARQKGKMIHELLHVLGFYHEHSIPFRDEFITVSPNSTGSGHNYVKLPNPTLPVIGTLPWQSAFAVNSYDYASIMHYPTIPEVFNFTANNPIPQCLANLTGLGSLGGNIGQRVDPTWIDITQLRRLYQCESGVRLGGDAYICSTDCPCWENAFGSCYDDSHCQGDLICGAPADPGPPYWVCEGSRILPTNMCKKNTRPVALCKDAIRAANENGQYFPNINDIDDGSYDPDGHLVDPIIQFAPLQNLDLGLNNVALFITDSGGLTATCGATIEVVAEAPPTPDPPTREPPPPVALCRNITRVANMTTAEGVRYYTGLVVSDIDAGSYDPKDNEPTIELLLTQTIFRMIGNSVASIYEVGLRITNSRGLSDTCTALLTVVRESPPEPDPEPDPESEPIP